MNDHLRLCSLVTRWLRDEATGLVTNKVYADGKGPRYDYTPDGRLATRTWARGIDTTYSYDDNGSLTNTVYSDGTPTISLSYNRAGRQVRAEDAAGVTTFLYDDFGEVTNETVIDVAGTNTVERFYDTFGRNAGYAPQRHSPVDACLRPRHGPPCNNARQWLRYAVHLELPCGLRPQIFARLR